MIKFAAIAIALLLAAPAAGQEQCRATDGDTIKCGDQSIRVMGLDTPEIFTPNKCGTPEETQRVLRLGYAAKGRLDRLLSTRQVTIAREGFDRYGRIVGHVYAGQDNVANLLIAEGLARPYVCKDFRCPRRETWCNQ